MGPWNSRKHRLHQSPIRIGLFKLDHIFQPPDRAAFTVGRFHTHIYRNVLHKLVSSGLALNKHTADVVIQQHIGIHMDRLDLPLNPLRDFHIFL